MLSSQTVNNYETPKNKPNIIPSSSNENNLQIFCKDLSKINELDECGWTPLYRTIIAGDVSSSKYLIEKGADPNIKCTMGETPLYQAVEMEKIEHIKLLLKKGADPNITNDDDLSPLHIAVNKQNITIVKLLLKYGANPNLKSKLYQQTPLHLAIKNNADPIFLLLLVQFNGSLLNEDKFNKKPVDYTNSKEMQNTIEKLKFGYDDKIIEKEKEIQKFETPSKNFDLSINNIYSNTIRSKSKAKNLIIGNSNAILQNPGNINLTIIDNKNNIFSNNKEIIENNNIIINEENKENINNNNDNNHNEYNNIIKESNKSEEKDLDIKNKENDDYSLLRKQTGKFYDDKLENNINDDKTDDKIDNRNLINSFRPKSIKITNVSDIESRNNQKNSIRFSFSNDTFKNNKIKTSLKKSVEDKENINNNINDNNKNEEEKTKKYKKQKNNKENQKKKKIIIKKYINKEENGNIKNKKDIMNKFDKNNCLYEKIIKKSITKIEIYDEDIKEETINQKVTKDTTNINNKEYSQIKSSNKSLYNKPILKHKIINNLKKIIKNDKNNKSIHNSIISVDNNKTRIKDIFTKKNQISFNKKNIEKENMNINTINMDKNNKRASSSRGSLTTLTASGNEYMKNLNIKNSQNNNNNNNNINDVLFNDKIIYQSNLSNNLNSEISNEYININNNNKYPIYYWLKEIGLQCYYNLFKERKIFSMEKIISNLKSGKYIITKKDIEKCGIIINGHIYRILTKLEIDSEKINSKINNYFFTNNKKNKEINISKNSVYICCGCCSNDERIFYNKIRKEFNLDQWLNKINMIKYKKNFIENGFDLFEYFILQMFSTIPIDDYILKEELDIENDKDRDIILLRLNKDVKYIMMKAENLFSNEIVELENQEILNNSECLIM